ncbi:MAG: ergothioneine biosynthesis protein EgtB [Wenzhouxiangellaceae bacterium]
MSLLHNAASADPPDAGALLARYRQVRACTEALAAGLEPEDQNLQSMPEASPIKWHRAHTSWFFETFVLADALPGYQSPNPHYRDLFNSYYNAVGEQHPRPRRALISRPDVHQVAAYRAHVDNAMARLLESLSRDRLASLAPVIELGLNHEQQHQELMLTDLKHAFSFNPLAPPIGNPPRVSDRAPPAVEYVRIPAGIHTIGAPETGFAFDNERPRHRVLIENDFEIATRPVSWAEWLQFIDDGAYHDPMLWLSDGWAWRTRENIDAPLYARRNADGAWEQFTTTGWRPVDPAAPVSHISCYEAHAFALWAGARLPTEQEWEIAATSEYAPAPDQGHFADSGRWHPEAPQPDHARLQALFGSVWEWTASPYVPWPGFRAAPGALGEYNGKFMANQIVLRGGSCATPAGHVRPSYRNFFYPQDRWQFSGLRLARDA